MVVMYANCPIFWPSSLKTEIALSKAEAEYIELSSALRQVFPLMTMMEEINDVFPLLISKPHFVWADIFTTIKRKVSSTTQTPQKVSNVMWMQISRAGGKKLTLTTLKT